MVAAYNSEPVVGAESGLVLRTNSDDFSGSCREDFLPDVLLVSILCVPAASQNGKRSWEAGGVKALIMKKRPTLPSNIAGLTPMELARKIPVREAAAFNSVHVQTFLRRYRHLVHRIGERRLFVTVHDAIMLPPPDTS